MARTFPIVLALTVPSLASATEYWTPDRIAASRGQHPSAFLARAAPPPFGGDYDTQLLQEAAFVASLQALDPTKPEYGGVYEAEHLKGPPYVQTDNTTESIWVWTRHYQLTHFPSYLDNIATAWIYVMNNPATGEEGGSGPLGYYRVHNCAWALVAESLYRRVTGDATYASYARQCADFLIANDLDIASAPYLAFSEAWGAATLFLYGKSEGSGADVAAAVAKGNRLRVLVEQKPQLLATEDWVYSGGTVFHGILTAAFGHDAAARKAWALAYAPLLGTSVGSGVPDNSWNCWYALAQHTAYEATASLAYHDDFRSLANALIAKDTDNDGGIPASSGDPSTQDQAWVSNYLAHLEIDRLRANLDLSLAPDASQVSAGQDLPFSFAMASHEPTTTVTYLVAWLDHPGGTALVAVLPVSVSGYGELALADLLLGVPPGSPAGAWKLRLDAYDTSLVLQDHAEFAFTVF
jgi:hypothetical protein